MTFYRSIISFLTVAIVLASSGSISAQLIPEDNFRASNIRTIDSLKYNPVYQRIRTAAPFIISGVALYNQGVKFQNLRNEFAPNYSVNIDKILEYSPTVLLYGLKISGVDSRSNLKRMVATHAISAASAIAVTSIVKYSVKERRPDGKGCDSYPSGHTAIAFMSAGMVHHEYGLTKSPWYSIGAYTLATATAISRVLNNQHYLQDVLLGSGIGILSTEFGYYLSDILFKNKGILMQDKKSYPIDINSPYSYFGLNIGFVQLFNNLKSAKYNSSKSEYGSSAGLEGAYYFCKHWGIGLSASANSTKSSITVGKFEIQAPQVTWYNIGTGPYFSTPLSKLSRIGVKFCGGYTKLFKREMFDYKIPSLSGTYLSAGLFLESMFTKGIMFKLYTNLEKNIFKNEEMNFSNAVYGASVNINLCSIRNNN